MDSVTALPDPSGRGSPTWPGTLRRLIPLWRHAVWVVALFALVVLWVDVRVDTQALRSDLRRSESARRAALEENEHLRLELDSRHRALAMEAAGQSLGLSGEVTTTSRDTPAPFKAAMT